MNATLKRYGTSLRCYDAGEKIADRYTVLPPKHDRSYFDKGLNNFGAPGMWAALDTWGNYCSAMQGPALGSRIHWDALPKSLQSAARVAFPEHDPELQNISVIAQAFCETAIWADAEEGTHPRIPNTTKIEATAFVRAYMLQNADICAAAISAIGYSEARFGHDLYLTCAGHGAGFWDRDELGDTGKLLTDAIAAGGWEVECYQHRGWLYIITNQG